MPPRKPSKFPQVIKEPLSQNDDFTYRSQRTQEDRWVALGHVGELVVRRYLFGTK